MCQGEEIHQNEPDITQYLTFIVYSTNQTVWYIAVDKQAQKSTAMWHIYF